MSRETFFEIVESELEISGISDMSIEEEVKSSKKEFRVSFNFIFLRQQVHGFPDPGTDR